MNNGERSWVGEVALGLFRPPADATSAGVRRSGALGMALGMVLFLASIALVVALGRGGVHVEGSEELMLAVVFPGLAFMIIGGYRVIAGREPEHASSFRRVALGVAGALFGFFVLIVAFIVVAVVTAMMKR